MRTRAAAGADPGTVEAVTRSARRAPSLVSFAAEPGPKPRAGRWHGGGRAMDATLEMLE